MYVIIYNTRHVLFIVFIVWVLNVLQTFIKVKRREHKVEDKKTEGKETNKTL